MKMYLIIKKFLNKSPLSKNLLLRKINKRIESLIKGKRIKIKIIEGSKMYLDPSDENGVSASLLLEGSYEKEETQLIKGLLKRDMVFVDIGANIGYYSLLASKSCKVIYSFEPDPRNFLMLMKNIRLNNYTNIYLFNKAVLDNNNPISFYMDSKNFGGSSFAETNPEEVGGKISIKPIRLDDIFIDSKIDLIKIDVQGAEERVIKGAINTIKNNPNIKIIMEFCPYGIRQVGDNPENLLNLLDELGFSMKVIEENLRELSPIDKIELCRRNDKGSMNLLLERGSVSYL